MWKKGELVWANFKWPDSWIPGRVQDPSEPFGVLVSFFGLMEPRYFPPPLLRHFEPDYRTLISVSRGLRRRIVNRALIAHFWSVSYGLWCPCQPPITSPFLDRENPLSSLSLSSDLAIEFVRNIAISLSVSLEGLAEANRSTALLLSFRRYTIDFERSESLYEEIRVCDERMGHSEESESSSDTSNQETTAGSEMGSDKDLRLRRFLEGDEVRICSSSPRKPLANCESSILMNACKSQARLGKQEDDDDPSKMVEHGHDFVVVAPAGQLSRLDAATTHGYRVRSRNNVKSIRMKRKLNLNFTSADSFKKQKMAAQRYASVDKALNPGSLSRVADPRCLWMKFLGNHNHLPSKENLVKRFSVFGKIDTSSTCVDSSKMSAKVVFLRSIDAVMAYKYARNRKISFGQCKVVYRFDLFKQSSERNEANTADGEQSVQRLKPCLKKSGSANEDVRRRNLKVKFFEMEDD